MTMKVSVQKKNSAWKQAESLELTISAEDWGDKHNTNVCCMYSKTCCRGDAGEPNWSPGK